MDSNNQNQGPPAEFIPGHYIQKIFKFGAWSTERQMRFG
jgi:hypothetical protein